MKRIHPFVTLTLLAAVSACNDVASPTSPLRPGDLPPAFGIFDGAHNGGNDRFFFLPPMVPRPTINAEFHAGLRPRVDICELANDVCVSGPSFKSFSSAEVRVSVADQHYHVNWDTKSPDVDPAKNYRIQVFLGDNRIGFADVDPVTNGSQLKHIQSDEFIGLVDGRTLPIKFFIGKGVTCTNRDNCAEYTVKSAEGGEFAAADERFWLEFPTDVFPAGFEEVTITVERKPVAASRICHALHLEGESDEDSEPALAAEYEGCYRVTMDRRSEDFIGAGGFQKPVTVAMCLTGTSLTNRFLRIYKSDPQPRGLVALADADPAVIEGFDSSCEGFGPTPPPSPGGTLGMINSGLRYLASAIGRALSPKPLYAVDLGLGGQIGIGGGFSDFGWGVEGRLDARSPLTRTVAPGTNQEFAVSVTGFTDHVGEAPDPEHQPTEEPLPGVDVRFELMLGGEVIASQVAQSVLEEGGEGEYTPEALAAATFTRESPGNYVVRATLAHSGGSPVSFLFNVAANGSIAGTVKDAAGAPFGGTPVRLVSTVDEGFTPRTINTDEAGAFTFSDVPAGTYAVSAAAVGFNIARQTVILDAGANQVVNLVLTPNGTITGVVLNALSEASIAGAVVSIVGTSTSTVTNSDGRFTLTGLRVGSEVQLSTSFVNFQTDTRAVNVGSDAQIALQPTPPVGASPTDPAGDATSAGAGNVAPDLVSATAEFTEGGLDITVRYAAGTFSPANSVSQLSLDLDQNPRTGLGITSSGTLDRDRIGAEMFVDIGHFSVEGQLVARVSRVSGTSLVFVDFLPITFNDDGTTITIPTDLLNDDGNLNFKLTSQYRLSATGFTGILDVMTNVGRPAASLSALVDRDGDSIPVGIDPDDTDPNVWLP